MFSLQVLLYKFIVLVIRILSRVLPQKPPVVLMGPGSSEQLCRAAAQLGVKKFLIVTDAELVRLGLHEGATRALDEAGVAWELYDGVAPDPSYRQIEDGLAVLKRSGCDAILAFGGGSPMDAAKTISVLATNDKSIAQLAGILKVRRPGLPVFAIPTTAGTGAEVTIAAVPSETDTHVKTPIVDPKLVPVMAALDPELMVGLPPHVTAATGMDALTHAVEAYVSVNATAETDRYALAATAMIFENLRRCYARGDDLDARQAMALAAHYAGLAFTKASVGYVHAVAHNFGARYQTPHGLANAIVMPYVLDFYQGAADQRLAGLARAAGIDVAGSSDEAAARRFVEAVRELCADVGIPQKLDALRAEDIPGIAKDALHEAHLNYPVPRYMDQPRCEALIRQMLA
jgi:alcohol dehydrogenase class IV